MIKIKVDFREASRGLNRLAKNQVPFAQAKSLTDLAKMGQKGVRKNTLKKFDIRAKKYIQRWIKIKSARKNDFKMHSEVFSHKNIDFMFDHEDGGIRTPQQSKTHSVPSSFVKAKNYRTSSGKVRKRFKPRELLKDFNKPRGTGGTKSKSRRKKAFIIFGSGNTPLIVRRKSKARKPLEILYNLKSRITIKQRWGFEKSVNGIVRNNFRRVFERNLNQAISTAR